MADYEKEWTFKPKLNSSSIRLVSEAGHANVPLTERLFRARKSGVAHLQENFTFSPKLNAASLRMAQERSSKLPEVYYVHVHVYVLYVCMYMYVCLHFDQLITVLGTFICVCVNEYPNYNFIYTFWKN